MSKGKSRTDLDLPARSRGFRNRAELRRIHEPVGSPQINFIEPVKCLQPNLEASRFGNRKIPCDREIESLLAGAVYGIAAGIPKCIRSGRRECQRVKPLFRRMGPRAKYGLPGDVGSHRILAQYGSGIRRIPENRNREW